MDVYRFTVIELDEIDRAIWKLLKVRPEPLFRKRNTYDAGIATRAKALSCFAFDNYGVAVSQHPD